MPRKAIEIPHKLEDLSILDEHGNVDAALDPALDADSLLKLFRTMLLTRRVDERLINMQRQGRIGTYGPCKGQEAAHVASAFCLKPEDWMIPAFREPGAMLLRGWPIESIMKFWGGYEEGNIPPPGVNDTPICVPVSSQCQYGMGIAWAIKLRKTKQVVMIYLGDGGTSEGDFHEAMNFAGVYTMPAVFVIQNNQYAISHPRHRQTAAPTLAQKAIAYGFDALHVDGNDPLAVYAAAREAVDKARAGGGPTLIEAVTYRLSVHTTADDPKLYRKDEEVARWEKRDPLIRFEKHLRAKKLLDDKLLAEIEEDIDHQIKQAVQRYETAKKAARPLDVFDHILAKLPPELVEQREEYAAELRAEGRLAE